MARKRNAKKAKVVASSQGQRFEKREPVLYDEIIFTILSWLPAKCLHGIMRYVCNTWAQLICNPHFVETHLQRSKPGLFLQKKLSPFGARFLEFKENRDFEITNLNTPYLGEILCSCEGMSVFHKRLEKVLYVANPIIMDVLEVPLCLDPRKCYCFYNMARLPNNGGFKLVCGDFEDEKGLISLHVLTLGIDDSWRKLGSVFRNSLSRFANSISIGQFIYWAPFVVHPIMPCEVVITDIANESISKFSFPKTHRTRGFVKIGNYFSCLQFSCAGFDIYVSKDVHLRSWEIYHKIVVPSPSRNILGDVYRFIACVDQELIFKAYVHGQDGTLSEPYFAYNMTTRQITSLEGHIHTSKDVVCLHTNSLVSWRSF